MGYTTDFSGQFMIDRPVDEETAKLLKGLANSRRMKRNIEGYGVEGEFYVEEVETENSWNTPKNPNIIDQNRPPRTQPGLWCQWLLQEDNQTIEWDGGEKFYEYVEWIKYLIDRILKPRGYFVSGEVEWFGESREDFGKITINKNVVFTKTGYLSYN